MILCDGEIKAALATGAISIDPSPEDSQFTSSALDLILGNELFQVLTLRELQEREPRGVEHNIVIDALSVDVNAMLRQYSEPLPKEKDGSVLFPTGRLVISQTRETISLPPQSRIAARVEGRSTLARLGLVVHLTAPVIHAGFSGIIALEMHHFGPHPLRLWPGKHPICQLVFERVGEEPQDLPSTPYQGQTGVR
jgi:dCTP deaminase